MSSHSFQPATALPRLNLLREVIYLAFVVMELCWIVPWYRSLTPASAAVPLWFAFGLLVLMALVSLYLTRLMNLLEASLRLRRRVLGLLLLASMFAGLRWLLYREGLNSLEELLTRPIKTFADVGAIIPDELIVFLLVIFVWWRGLRLAGVHLSPTRATSGFFFGFVTYAGFFLVVTLLTGETPGPLMPLFFFVSLIAMALTRVESLRPLRGARLPFGPARAAFLLVAAGATVGLGGLLGGWLTGGLQQLLLGILAVFVVLPVILILTPLVWLLLRLIRLIADSSGGFDLDFSPAIEALNQLMGNLDKLAGQLAEFLPVGVEDLAAQAPRIKLILTLLVVAGAFVAVLYALRRIRLRMPADRSEERESAFSADALLASLRDLWGAGRSRLGETGALLNQFGVGRDLFAALSIRRMYLQTLRLAAEEGHPRAEAETPLEHLPSLGRAFPAREADAELLTWAYVGVRYGELPDTEAGIEQVRAAFEAIRDQARRQARVRKHARRET